MEERAPSHGNWHHCAFRIWIFPGSRSQVRLTLVATSKLAITILASSILSAEPINGSGWNREKAFEYLEARQQKWAEWKPAMKAGGACVSCHTGLSYMLAKRAAAESQPAPQLAKLTEGVKHRVLANPPQTMLADPGAEAILNLLTLAMQRRNAKDAVAPADQLAMKRLWENQVDNGDDKGAWSWFLNDLHPVESEHSIFYGTVLADLASAAYPHGKSDEPYAAAMRDYLKRNFPQQPLHNRLGYIALGSAKDAAAKRSTLAELWTAQAGDGGWTTKSLGPWSARPDAPEDSGSNAYSTAWAAFTARQAGVSCSDSHLKRALDWLKQRQDAATGAWETKSMNKKFAAGSMQEKFMTDAATGFAAAALVSCPGN